MSISTRLSKEEITFGIEEGRFPPRGNWRGFHDFSWYARPDDADSRTVYHIVSRDSDLLEQSNASVFVNHVMGFPKVTIVRFNHWACGWIDALTVVVNTPRGRYTRAYRTLCYLIQLKRDLAVLDDADWAERVYLSTLENIVSVVQTLHGESVNRLPDNYARDMYQWFQDHDESAIEGIDGNGGYPSDDQVVKCIDGLWPGKGGI